MTEARTPEEATVSEDAAARRRARWARLPARIRPEEMTSAQPEARVPLPDDPHRESLPITG